MNEYHEKVRITKRYPKNSENDPISGKNQNIGRKSERPSNFRSFPCFSEDLATLIRIQQTLRIINLMIYLVQLMAMLIDIFEQCKLMFGQLNVWRSIVPNVSWTENPPKSFSGKLSILKNMV